MTAKGAERRREKRISLAEPIVARFGSSVVVVIDVSPLGAKIEHYSRLDRGAERSLRLQWGNDAVGIKSRVVRCRVERFIPGDAGITVYRSGLQFDESQLEEVAHIRQMISSVVAKTLVEQVANARGFWTEAKEDMPIFRDGVLTTTDPHLEEKLKGLLPNSDVVRDRGFIRLTRNGNSWLRKWTLDPEQPEDGFTISASEPPTEIDLLCDAYVKSDASGRDLIRRLAATSIEQQLQSSD